MRSNKGERSAVTANPSRVSLTQTVFHDKESLVLIRSVMRGLVLHFLVLKTRSATFEELKLGRGSIEKISSVDFEPERAAEYREHALAIVEKKVEGEEIKALPPAPRRSRQVVDIFAALKKSLESAERAAAKSHRSSQMKKESVGRDSI